MTYHLSAEIMLDTLQAMAALQAMACEPDRRAILAPILCRERSRLSAELIRNAFVEVVLKLGPLVTDMDLGDEAADTADCLMSVELLTPAGFCSSRHTFVRRALEQTVAFTALHSWCRASVTDGAASKAASGLADSFASAASGWYDTLVSAVTPGTYPTVRD